MLEEIAATINNTPGYWAERDRDEDSDYLLRFGKLNEDGENDGDWLVLMHDYGVTWEPSRAYTTPRYCTITTEDPAIAVQQLIRLVDAYERGDLGEQGEGDGERFL